MSKDQEASRNATNGAPSPRLLRLIGAVKATVEEASGVEVSDSDDSTSFLDLGLDSLFLTQVA
ncbi:MAG TPA: acyl carrier protein, partial [Polyangiaceae bacterium]